MTAPELPPRPPLDLPERPARVSRQYHAEWVEWAEDMEVRVVKGDRRIAALEAELAAAKLEAKDARRKALEEIAAACPKCKGKGKYEGNCRLCGDSTYDHYCEYPVYDCFECAHIRASLAADAASSEVK